MATAYTGPCLRSSPTQRVSWCVLNHRAKSLAAPVVVAVSVLALVHGQDRTAQSPDPDDERIQRQYLEFSPYLMDLLYPRVKQPRPTVPYESPGACPFECCVYREWTVEQDTDVFGDYRKPTSVNFRVRRGETVTALTGVVVTTKLGMAIVRSPRASLASFFKPGERFDVIHHVSEGHWKYWFNGYFDVKPMAETKQCPGPACEFELVQEPQTVWWANVRARNGREGWTREPRHFGNKDRCG